MQLPSLPNQTPMAVWRTCPENYRDDEASGLFKMIWPSGQSRLCLSLSLNCRHSLHLCDRQPLWYTAFARGISSHCYLIQQITKCTSGPYVDLVMLSTMEYRYTNFLRSNPVTKVAVACVSKIFERLRRMLRETPWGEGGTGTVH